MPKWVGLIIQFHINFLVVLSNIDLNSLKFLPWRFINFCNWPDSFYMYSSKSTLLHFLYRNWARESCSYWCIFSWTIGPIWWPNYWWTEQTNYSFAVMENPHIIKHKEKDINLSVESIWCLMQVTPETSSWSPQVSNCQTISIPRLA